ncbi:nucleotidyltransferase domain-containing protein [Desulfosporosinus fructosivorans]
MDSVLERIKEISLQYKVDKIVLFGSRARGDHSSVSDYDIAIYGNDLSALDKACLRNDADEIETLKKIDIIFVQTNSTDGLMESIKRDGVIIYE